MNREEQQLANRLKNERRRRAKSNGPKAKHARELRREFGGAFGRAPDKVYDTCRVGTTSVARPISDEVVDEYREDLGKETGK